MDRNPITEASKNILLTHEWPEFHIKILQETHKQEALKKSGTKEFCGPGAAGAECFISSRYIPTTFKGLQANERHHYSFVEPFYTELIFNFRNYGWLIFYPNTDLDKHEPIYDQILSTFKFLP